MSADDTRVGRAAAAVPAAEREELMRRLAAAGYEHNQTDLEFLRAIPRADVPHVLSVLQTWLDEVGPTGPGPELMELRDALAARAAG